MANFTILTMIKKIFSVNKIKPKLPSMAKRPFMTSPLPIPQVHLPEFSLPMIRHLNDSPFTMGFHAPSFIQIATQTSITRKCLPSLDSSYFTQHPSFPLSILLKHTNFYWSLSMECCWSPSVKPPCPFLGRVASPSTTFLNLSVLSFLCAAIISSHICLSH